MGGSAPNGLVVGLDPDLFFVGIHLGGQHPLTPQQ